MEEWVGLRQPESDGRKARVDGEPVDASIAECVGDFHDGRGGGVSVADIKRGASRMGLANVIMNDWGPKHLEGRIRGGRVAAPVASYLRADAGNSDC